MELYLIRHTAVALPPGRCYGQRDVPLATSWRDAARAVRAKLPEQAVDRAVVYSSPLSRCLQLAQLLSNQVHSDARLRELDFGAWEGLRWNAIPAQQMTHWSQDYFNNAVPGGESFRELCVRTGAAFDEIVQSGAPTALIITHGGPIRALLARLLDLPPERALRLHIDYGGLSAVTIEGAWVKIHYINR